MFAWRGHLPGAQAMTADRAAVMRVAAAFDIDGDLPVPFGDGLIHTTLCVAGHLLQRLNGEVFPDPVAVAENAAAAASRVDDALRTAGDLDPRHRLVYLPGPEGRPWYRDGDDGIWRAMILIPGARPAGPAEARAAALALGRFPGLVDAGEGPEVRETMPGFHDTIARFGALRDLASFDPHGRLAYCRSECKRLLALAGLAARLRAGELPVRPVHNDAKPDNVLVDVGSGEALCVIDLDTVQPGLAAHDFGDLVRATVTGRPEDEPDLVRVALQEDVFRDLAAGYLEGAAGWLTPQEHETLVDGALVITCEQAVRFLCDYLAGDTYYRISEAGHNLRRARAQLRLLEELLAAENDLRRVVSGV